MDSALESAGKDLGVALFQFPVVSSDSPESCNTTCKAMPGQRSLLHKINAYIAGAQALLTHWAFLSKSLNDTE